MKFKNFIKSQWSESLKLDKARTFRKNNKKNSRKKSFRSIKQYKPGTFGIEIEFKTGTENSEDYIDFEDLVDQITQQVQSIQGKGYGYNLGINNYHSPKRILAQDYEEWMSQYLDEIENPEHPDDWESDNEEPEPPQRADYDDENEFEEDWDKYEEEQKYWQAERDEIEEKWERFSDDGGYEGLPEKFARKVVDERSYDNYEIYPEYEDGYDSTENKIAEYENILQELDMPVGYGGYSNWHVHEDGEGIVELSSPILTSKDIPKLKELISYLQNEPTDGGTSCHVHVGMPQNTDGFDLIAMTTLTDEDSVKKDAGWGREFSTWAAFNDKMHKSLYYNFEDRIYEKEEFLSKVQSSSKDRNVGTNISAFFEHKTVEFRYLSSQIIENPQMVFKWINYYLTLPYVAQGRKQIKIKSDGNEMYFNRLSNGSVQVKKNPKGRVSQHPDSPHDLRKDFDKSSYQQQREKLMYGIASKKLARMSIKDVLINYNFDNIYYEIKNGLSVYLNKTQQNNLLPKNDPHLNDQSNFYNIASKIPMSAILDKIHRDFVKTLISKIVKDITQKPY